MEPFLEGIRVLDLTRLLPGPYATTMLADLGAEVIKVEEPTRGDPTRHRAPFADDRSYTFLVRNRNKSSVGIDLKDERGRAVFLELARTADVVVESFRPGVCDRLGVGYDDVTEVNEDIVYCSLTGYGQYGPYAEWPGHDINYIGVSGLLSLTGKPDEPPSIPGYPVADFAGGLCAAFAIAAALVGVQSGKSGDHLDISITDVVASFATIYADEFDGDGVVPQRRGTRLNGYHPGNQVYESADGQYISLAAIEQKFWKNLCEAIDAPELKELHFRTNETEYAQCRDACEEVITSRIAERPADAWIAIFDRCDVPASPVNEYDELFDDPHLNARGLFDTLEVESARGDSTEVRQISTPIQSRGDRKVEKSPASRLGSDTEQILTGIGIDAATVAELADDDVITPNRDV